MKPTVERLRSLLLYDECTGVITWRRDSRFKEAGNVRPDGHRRIKVDGKLYYAHVIAWAIYYGEWPETTVDHEDRDGFNNRIGNLRKATYAQQSQNRVFKKNQTGARGIRFQSNGKYTPQIQYNGKKKALGTYETLAEAVEVRALAESMFFGEFAPFEE